jgi:PAS domain S-box-containing protein
VADEAAKVSRPRPEALAADFVRRASSARAIAGVFMVMTVLAASSTLAMTRQWALALPQALAMLGFAAAYGVARKQERASQAGSIIVAVMLAQYVASSHASRLTQDVIAIAYFVALCPLVAKATMRWRGVLFCGVAGVVALVLQGYMRNNAAPGHWRELIGPGYYFAATWLVAVFAAIGSERALRAHVREELRAAHAQAEAREAEQRYRLVSEQVSDLVSVLDDQGRFVYVSPSHERVLGLPVAELLGRSAPEIVHPDDLQGISAAFLKTRELGSSFTVARLRAKDGSYRWFHIRFSRTEDAQAGGTIATSARDITEQQRLSEALEGTRRMESLGRLAGGVAHDFNNLLLVIQACTDLASRQLPPEHPARADLSDILRTTERAAALTKQLLTFARRQVLGTRQRASVSKVAQELAPILERLCGKGIQASFALQLASSDVTASAVEIEQILMNLAANARDAMPDGGTLHVALALRGLDEGELGELRAGDYVEILMKDSGVGMSADVQARIFEPFFTTKPAGRGTGLGLATVFGLVAQLGGHIAVSSQVGEGTEFRVLLPCAVQEATSAVLRAAQLTAKSLEVLVVDDEEAIRTLIGRILEAAGHRVTQAASAEMAIAAAKTASARFDAIVTDVVLGADDGLATLDTLRGAHPQAVVIVMSGYSPTPERVAELARQGAEFLPKPFGAGQLMAALDRARSATS